MSDSGWFASFHVFAAKKTLSIQQNVQLLINFLLNEEKGVKIMAS